jgi:DNA invertase Pin-like site-specific DNA recombinase
MRYNEEKLTHGGARKGAGRPATSVDKRRVEVLMNEGVSTKAIAERFGVTAAIIKRVIREIKNGQTN